MEKALAWQKFEKGYLRNQFQRKHEEIALSFRKLGKRINDTIDYLSG